MVRLSVPYRGHPQDCGEAMMDEATDEDVAEIFVRINNQGYPPKTSGLCSKLFGGISWQFARPY